MIRAMRVFVVALCLGSYANGSVASRIERQPEGESQKVASRGKNVAENATFSLRLVN